MNNTTKFLGFLIVIFLLAGFIIFQGKEKNPPINKSSQSSEEIAVSKDSSGTPVKNLPRLIDLGRGTCKACKMMLPILEELKEEYKGRAIIKITDIRYEPEPARLYKIRLIPTQIFFDAEGKEVFRHEGFMDKLSIEQKLKEIGVK